MRFARTMTLAVAILLAWGAPAAHAGDDLAAKRLIQAAVADAMQAYGTGQTMGPDERKARLARLLERYGDMTLYSADALGRYWGRTSPSERSAFGKVLERYLLGCWASSLNDISPRLHVDFTTTETLPDGRLLLHSLAVVPNDTLAIDWTIAPAADGHPIIADVSVDGISVFQTMKSDFLSILRTNGGRLDALSEALQKKSAVLGEAR